MRRYAVAAMAALALLAAVLLPGPAHAGSVEPTPGTRLTDDRGRVLTLRGWNVGDKTHRGADALSAITERHFRDMAAQGFDFARLLVFWDDLEPEPGRYSRPYLRKIEQVLDWAHQYRIHVVIDAHQDVFGPRFGHRGIPEWATRTDGLPFTPHPDDWFSEYFEPAVQAAFQHLYQDADLRRAQARMWRLLAERFGGHPAVLGYDLINEPMGRINAGEDLPTAARRIESRQLTPMYSRIADAVRQVDTDGWLFVEPTPIVGEGVPTGLGRIDDPKVVYAPHLYNAAMEAGGDYDPDSGWLEAYETAVVGYPHEHGIPVVVGEWGPLNGGLPNMGRFHDDALASMDRYSGGWAGWEWCYGGGYCAMDVNGRLRPNKERTVRPYARAVAGEVHVDSYSPATHTYRLSYEPQRGGTTELSLPPAPVGRRVVVVGPASARPAVVPAGKAATVRVTARSADASCVTVVVTPTRTSSSSERGPGQYAELTLSMEP
ncbi:cellulase family glycosylhydrolase [Streptomyces sp. NPDC050625]|uniref:glycoside hydrolase family 5 protein n=1 Tax=Streptomyces sp. NPDC050625 TaxID=3154629 RepID=UPI00341646BA